MNNSHKAATASVYLALGTNLGNREANMIAAIKNIEKQIGTIVSQSAFYVSEPSGFESVNLFLNSVVRVETDLLPNELIDATQQIELDMGRKEKSDLGEYTDRVIDIDILFYNEEVICNAPRLIVPHPRIIERSFVLKPLAEIAPSFVHPVVGKTVAELLAELEGSGSKS